jgi:hypothetical protein
LEVYEKDGVKEKRMNSGIAVDLAMNRFWRMENVIRTIEFYIGEMKNTPQPLSRGS